MQAIKSAKSSIINDSFSLVYDKKDYKSITEYFQLIQELIQKYNKNKIKPIDSNPNLDNISFPKNITYQILILKYIAFEYEKGSYWLKELYEKIIEQSFPSEEYFINLFNISEFEVRTKPQCFQSPNTKKKIPQSRIFTYDLIPPSVVSNDPLIKYKLYKQHIYKYVQIIREQIESPANPINFILKNFRYCISKEIINRREELLDLKLSDTNDIFPEKCNKIITDIFEQVNNFIYNLTHCLILLYSKINNNQIFFEEMDSFISLLISLLFDPNIRRESKDEFYTGIMDLIKLKNYKKIENFKKIIKSSRGIEPEDFNVQENFCLNEKSVNYYIKCFKKNFDGIVPDIPYNKSIQMLREIYDYKSPIDKLLLTSKLSKCIKNEIDEFWGQLPEEELKSEELKMEIEIDHYINIFEYMIVKAGMDELIAHIDFVEIFTNSEIRKEFDDYTLQQIKVGLMQINDSDKKK